MPEESHSALHQGPMGEGKDLRNYVYYAPVIAVFLFVVFFNLASGVIWLFNQ